MRRREEEKKKERERGDTARAAERERERAEGGQTLESAHSEGQRRLSFVVVVVVALYLRVWSS